MQGGSGEFYLDPLPDHEVLEAVVWITATSIAAERTQQLVSSSLELIGNDATALAEAQAALAIPAPVNPADIDHNDLAARDAADAHPADAIEVTPAGDIAETDVQAALEGLDDRKLLRTVWAYLDPIFEVKRAFNGLTATTVGSGVSWFVGRAQWLTQTQKSGFHTCYQNNSSTMTTGTNAAVFHANVRGGWHLYDGARWFMRFDLNVPSRYASIRIGFSSNDPALPLSTTARPTYGIWLEYDPTTHGDSNWRLCAANGGAVSTDDTGILAATSSEQALILEFVSTTSVKVWSLSTGAAVEVGSVTTNIPTTWTERVGVPFIQSISANTGLYGHVCLFEFGVLRDTHPNYLLPA